MAIRFDITERSFIPVTAVFEDDRDVPRVPDTVHWKLVCVTTDTVLVDWTPLTPAATVEFEIGSTMNRIIDNANADEVKELTVEANQDTERAWNQVEQYRVINGRARL